MERIFSFSRFLVTYCANYPNTNVSVLLPPQFTSEFVEGRDPVTNKIPRRKGGLSTKEENRVRGMEVNLSGDEGQKGAQEGQKGAQEGQTGAQVGMGLRDCLSC